MNIVERIYRGVQNNELPSEFTLEDVDTWLKKYNILQDNGKAYTNINSIRSSLYTGLCSLPVNKKTNADGNIISYYF